jgi:hypothetical protein
MLLGDRRIQLGPAHDLGYVRILGRLDRRLARIGCQDSRRKQRRSAQACR